MLLLDRQRGATAEPRPEANRPAARAGRVQLRLRADGQLLELLPGKTTIGSSPRCNVRIARPGVQPLHCLITDSPEGLRVRSWVPNTTINGEPVEESALNVGDCLSLGRIELDVVEPLAGESQEVFVEAPVTKRNVTDTVRAGRDQARARSRQLLDTLRRERTNHEELCRQVVKLQESHLQAVAEQNEIGVKLENCLAELAAARRQLDESEGIEAARRELVSQNEQLDREISELSAQIKELTHARSETAKQRQHLAEDLAAVGEQQRQLVDANTWLQGELSQLSNEKAATDEQNWQLSEQLSQLQSELRRLTEENAQLAAAKATLADEQARLIAEQKRLAELEREIGAAVAGRESTSAELYRALLQLAELQERVDQNKAIVEAYQSLSKEHEQLREEVKQFQEQINRLNEERAAAEGAWQALSAEAATLAESHDRIAGENAMLVTRLDEARQQLERAQQEQRASANGAAEVDRERAARLQAEAAISAAIAEGERRLEDQERRLTEQVQQFAEQSTQLDELSRRHAEQLREYAAIVNALERQLAEANDTRDALTRAREELQIQLSDGESHRSEQALRIQELESQLAAAEERAANAAEFSAKQSETARKNAVVESDCSARQDAESEPHAFDETPAEFCRSSTRSEMVSDDKLNSRDGDDTISESSIEDSTASDAASDARWTENASLQTPADASTFGEDDSASAAKQRADEMATTEPTLVWSPPAAQPGFVFDEPVFAKSEPLVQPERKTENGPAARHVPPSFIERYSHMFADDAAASDGQPIRANEPGPQTHLTTGASRSEGEGLSAGSTQEDEDSIEQYMAKLLQRVRGESTGGTAASGQPSRAPLNVSAAQVADGPIGNSISLAKESTGTLGGGDESAADVQPVDRIEPAKRRVSTPAPLTDLGALRALANETARHAISQHELRKLRRNAVTKVIVSTLAGVTSLWLMLDSPEWRNVQFIGACGLLLVAAYWAGETYRTLLNLMRIRAYEGPEETALPIDVEGDERG